MKYDRIEDAARSWVNGFNAIPSGIVDKLFQLDEDGITEITPPSKYDRVYIYSGTYADQYGEVVGRDGEDSKKYLILLDDNDETVSLDTDDFEVERDSMLPMWGTMWAFGEQTDNDWLSGRFNEDALQKMADCGFRIYEQEDYQYIFGIDGAGYSFMEEHWIPLYKARGLHWHKEGESE